MHVLLYSYDRKLENALRKTFAKASKNPVARESDQRIPSDATESINHSRDDRRKNGDDQTGVNQSFRQY